MTELEYVKTCRGPAAPVSGDYAWGTPNIASASYTATDAGAPSEGVNDISITAGNAQYTETDDFGGPMRVGAIAASVVTPGRQQSGAGYYGVMDLSGNVSEICISAGSSSGRGFSDNIGNGFLDVTSAGTNWPTSWPGTDTDAFSIMGGNYSSSADRLEVGNRTQGAVSIFFGSSTNGFRGVIRGSYTPN